MKSETIKIMMMKMVVVQYVKLSQSFHVPEDHLLLLIFVQIVDLMEDLERIVENEQLNEEMEENIHLKSVKMEMI